MMRKEQVEIKKMGINGEGIGYINKKICFIKNALPGEIVEVEIIEDNRKFLKGNVLKYLQTSPYRQKTCCKEDKYCQGCSLTTLQYDQHLPFKKGILKDALKKYTEFDVEKLPIKATLKANQTQEYRKVVSLPITYFNGKVWVGIYQRESKYLTFMNNCHMQDPLINECLVKIEDILNAHKVRDYNDKIKKGLRFMRLRNIQGKIQVLFVTGNNGISKEVINEVAKIDAIESIFYTINTTRYQEFEAQGYTKLYGKSKVQYQCFDQQYLYSIKSQYPVYPEMEEVKMEIIKSFIQPQASMLSLNCGIGIMELSMDNEIVAIDEKNYHIQDAKENAKFLKKNHVDFVCRNIDEETIKQCKKRKFDYVVIRQTELSQAIIQSLILSKVQNVVIETSHPSDLAKALDQLSRNYCIETIIPVDTYPYSAKFDTIVKLVRK
mgnify:CR=1 FL=1